jgi:hypothetical protein
MLLAFFQDLRGEKRVHLEKLELHGVAPQFCSYVYEGEATAEVAMVIARYLSNKAWSIDYFHETLGAR